MIVLCANCSHQIRTKAKNRVYFQGFSLWSLAALQTDMIAFRRRQILNFRSLQLAYYHNVFTCFRWKMHWEEPRLLCQAIFPMCIGFEKTRLLLLSSDMTKIQRFICSDHFSAVENGGKSGLAYTAKRWWPPNARVSSFARLRSFSSQQLHKLRLFFRQNLQWTESRITKRPVDTFRNKCARLFKARIKRVEVKWMKIDQI